ncbi:hypothetical protein [Paenibacillus peoriae]|uniref:hypothetical protein n=1 Tax=Paenibacillus peoriae TaxID=59893 RepID=UPI00096F4F47|nr:hypothetical protein [Paenibacillus peoriae]OMF34940.1 hypothetical protein BK134_06790 [Paenibacillus peoriae]
MIVEKTYFQPSINIRFDLGKSALYERYLPTPSHIDSTVGILKGILEEGIRSHIIVGSYGSGKSLLGTILAGVFSNEIEDQLFYSLLSKFQTVDNQIHKLLLDVKKKNVTYIPVILGGEEINFKQNLLAALYTTLNDKKLDFTQPFIVSDILNIVKIWEKKYKTTFDEFSILLKKRSWTFETWKKDIEKVNVKAIDWFKKIYPTLTSGSKLNLNFDKDLITQLEYITKELRKRNLGLFIVYDEFGRFLQSLPSTAIHETMQDLQDLSEFANSDLGNNLSVLLITHRNLSQYALRYNEELQKEFQRIEKRYSTYYTKSDSATFIRLSSFVTKEYREGKKLNLNENVKELRYFNLFPDLNTFEIDSLVIRESYPLHPVSLFVLPPLANITAQNERTLFTFLESDEHGGLKAYYSQHEDWYRIDTVFDYFEPSFSEFESDSLVGQSYMLYQRLQKRMIESKIQNDEIKIIKLLTIWSLAGLYSQQDPNEDFISFAFSWSDVYTKQVLESLEAKKAIRFNNALDHWELFEGSSVDVKAEVEKRLQLNPQNKRQKMSLLHSVLQQKYILPRKYNDEKSITRFAPIVPIYYSELMDQMEVRPYTILQKESDAVIYYVFNDIELEHSSLLDKLMEESIKEEKALFVVANEELFIDRFLETLAMLNLMREDRYFTSQDKFLYEELGASINQLTYKINDVIKPITRLQNSTWVYQGRTYAFKSDIELSVFLSDEIMNRIYYNTPEIRNESFNRRTITKVQRKAAIHVLNEILQFHNTNAICIKGFGPEYLIYATVIRRNHIDFNDPNITHNDSLLALREELLRIIHQRSGRVSDLVNVFETPPYGIRKPVVPLLFASLLYREWNYLMFYHNSMVNNKVDGDLLYYMIEHPEQYSFKYIPFNLAYNDLVKTIKIVFEDFVKEEDERLHPALFTNHILLGWLRSLPRITQNTQQTSELTNIFKTCIREGEVQPDISLERLNELLGNVNKHDVLMNFRKECEKYNDQHKKLIEEKIHHTVGVTTFEELKRWAYGKETIVRASNVFVKSLIAADELNWVDTICEKIVGVKRENWSDTTDQLFVSQIKSNLESPINQDHLESYLEVKIGDDSFAIQKADLSEQSQALLRSTKANFTQLTRRVPKTELQVMLIELLREFIKD